MARIVDERCCTLVPCQSSEIFSFVTEVVRSDFDQDSERPALQARVLSDPPSSLPIYYHAMGMVKTTDGVFLARTCSNKILLGSSRILHPMAEEDGTTLGGFVSEVWG